MPKNSHPIRKHKGSCNLNSKYIFVNDEATISFQNVTTVVNSKSGYNKQTTIYKKRFGDSKIMKKAPPVPPLPLVLAHQKNKNEILKVPVPSIEIRSSNANLQPTATRSILSDKTTLENQNTDFSNTFGLSNEKNIVELLLKPNRKASRPAKRPAPKPLLSPPIIQLSHCESTCHPLKECCKDPRSHQIEKLKKCIPLFETDKDETSKTYLDDKNIHCFTGLLNKNIEQCSSATMPTDLPPELPAKKISHDTKTLFGYSMEEQVATRKLHGAAKQNCNNYTGFKTKSLTNCTSSSISVTKVLPQFDSSLDCTTTLAKSNIANDQMTTNISPRELFYKSLSLQRRKKSNCKNKLGRSQFKTCTSTGCHCHPILPNFTKSNATLNVSGQNVSHNTKEIKAENMVSNSGLPNILCSSLMKNSNDINCIETSQDGYMLYSEVMLEQPQNIVTVYKNISIPFRNTCEKHNFKIQHKNSNNNHHLQNKNDFLKEKTDHGSCVSKIASSNISMAVTDDNYIKFPLSPVISNLEAEPTDSSKSVACVEKAIHAFDKMDNKLGIIKESKNVSTYTATEEIFLQERISDIIVPPRKINKDNSDVQRTVNDDIKYRNKRFGVDDKQFFLKTTFDNSILEITKNNKKTTEQFLDDMSESMLQADTDCAALEGVLAEQVKSKENNVEEINLLKSKHNIPVLETCHDMCNVLFLESHNNAKVIPKLVNVEIRNKPIFQKSKYDRLTPQQNIAEVVTKPFSMVKVAKVHGLCFAKEKLTGMKKAFPSELHSFSSENDSPYIGYKLGVNTQNRNSEICLFAKSTRLLQETSTLTDIQQTSTTSEISSLLKLGPRKIYNQGTVLFPIAGTMSTQQLNTIMLFRQLEAAIASGHHKKAAILARELALHKVECSLTSLNISEQTIEEEPIMVNLYIEDKDLHQGPFPLLVHCNMTLGALKSKLEKEFALPKKLQRWIIGKRLAADDDTTLQDFGVTETGCSIFLYLVCGDSSENQNNLLMPLSKMREIVAVQKLSNSNDITLHKKKKDVDSFVQVVPDVENTLHANNISEDEDFSDVEDSYLINSTCISPVGNIDCSAEDSETDESENHRHTPVRHFISDYEEINEESMSEHSPSSDDVIHTHFFEQQEKTLLNCEQNENELNINQINALDTDTNKDDIIHLRDNSVNSHSFETVAVVMSINGFIEENGEVNSEEQAEEFANTIDIPITEGKKQKEKIMEQRLNSYSLDVDFIDKTQNSSSDEEREQVYEENEVYFNASDEYINPVNKEVSTSGQGDDLLKSENAQTVFLAAISQQQIEFEKQEEMEDEEEQHGYLPDMEYIAVINEFDADEREEEHIYEENQIKSADNYAMPTAIKLAEEKVKDLHNTEHIQIQVPSIWLHRIPSAHIDERMGQNATVASLSCGSPHSSPNDICKSCKPVAHVENVVDRLDDINKNAETLLGSIDCSREIITDYQYLLQLDNQDLIPNAEPFWCCVCFTDIRERQGVVLRDCLHQFCKECLAGSVEYAESTIIKCPFRNEEYSCDSHLQEREIKAVVTAEVFERYMRRGMIAAEGRTDNSFHCKMPDCPGWCILDAPISMFQCPTCSHINCLRCQAIHEGINCQQYQDEQQYQLARNEEVKETKNYLDSMVNEGKAMLCPKCDAFVIKRWGCDWLKCSVCQTEICWVTKKARWGPEGHGDTSDGCKCGVNGQRCHPKCNYCH